MRGPCRPQKSTAWDCRTDEVKRGIGWDLVEKPLPSRWAEGHLGVISLSPKKLDLTHFTSSSIVVITFLSLSLKLPQQFLLFLFCPTNTSPFTLNGKTPPPIHFPTFLSSSFIHAHANPYSGWGRSMIFILSPGTIRFSIAGQVTIWDSDGLFQHAVIFVQAAILWLAAYTESPCCNWELPDLLKK